jgi:hypothetical protein
MYYPYSNGIVYLPYWKEEYFPNRSIKCNDFESVWCAEELIVENMSEEPWKS